MDDNFSETVLFLAALRKAVLDLAVQYAAGRRYYTRIPIYADFCTIRYLSISVGLIIASIYDRNVAITKRKPSTVNEKLWDRSVALMLRAFGFKELLQMNQDFEQDISVPNFRILKFSSGNLAVGQSPGELQEKLASLLPQEESQKLLYAEPYAGIFEAILNSHVWAYPDDHRWDFPSVGKWWITGAVDVNEALVTIVAYDQGVSIPAMLPHWEHYGKIKIIAGKLFAKLGISRNREDPLNDGLALRMAMKIAKTGTGLPQHGKGLHTMLEVAERAPWGRLRVVSRNGEFIWTTGRRPISRSHETPLEGTLIEWQLQLK